MIPLAGMLNSVELSPTAEITTALAVLGTLKLKLPVALVVVPIRVPFAITDALETGAPLASVTLPETVLFWVASCS